MVSVTETQQDTRRPQNDKISDIQITSAITTCPRQGHFSYLAETLGYLAEAGFHPETFNDPDKKFSAYGNSLRALEWILENYTNLDGLLIFQDDIMPSRNLRRYIEKTLWPADPETIGAVSLFTPVPRAGNQPGWHQADLKQDPSVVGGLGLLFPKHSAELLVANPPRPGTRQGWDNRVREHCENNGLSLWYHTPSLVAHIGMISAIGIWPELWLPRICREFCLDCDLL